MIEEAISNNGNKTYLRILSQYRLLGMANTELQFEMAMRDQIILNQQEAQRNMWNLLMGLGLDEKWLSEIAAKQGILVEDWTMTSCPGFSDNNKQSQNLGSGSYTPLPYCACSGQSFAKSSRIFQQTQDIGARSFFKGNWNVPRTFCREEYHSSYYYTTEDNYPTALMRLRKNNEHCLNDGPSSVFGTPDKYHQGLHNLYQHTRTLSSPYSKSSMQTSSFSADFQQQQKESRTNISRQQQHMSSPAGTSASQDSCSGLMTHHGWFTQGRFGYSPMEQVPTVVCSNHIFPKFVPPNRPNMSQVLPLYASSRSIHVNSHNLDSHPSSFM